MSQEKVLVKLSDYCLLFGLDASIERIKATTVASCRMNEPKKVLLALDSLMGWCSFFPDVAKINQEINRLKAGGLSSIDKATVECKYILDTIKELGFDANLVKKKLDNRLYNAIGGAMGIKEYGSGETPEGVFIKQLTDKLRSSHAMAEAQDKITAVEKIAGKGAVQEVMSESKQKPKAVDFNKFLPDNS